MADCPPCQTVRADAEIMLRGSFDPVYPASHLDPNQRLARARWPERDGLDLKHFGLESTGGAAFYSRIRNRETLKSRGAGAMELMAGPAVTGSPFRRRPRYGGVRDPAQCNPSHGALRNWRSSSHSIRVSGSPSHRARRRACGNFCHIRGTVSAWAAAIAKRVAVACCKPGVS